jgi:5'(3')-deoxyribonucleotidase
LLNIDLGFSRLHLPIKTETIMVFIDPARLAFDIDGVIADTMHLFIDILREHYNVESVRYEDITEYRLDRCLDLDETVIEGAVQMLLDGGYRPTLKAIPGAGSVLRKIGEITGHILMVTARPDPELIDQWMGDLLDGQHANSTIIATGSHEAKTDILLERGIQWFVEDRLATCELLKAAGIEPVLFKQPWNRRSNEFLQVESWEELERKISFP